MSALATVVLIACATAPGPAAAAVTPVARDGVVERYARALGDANGSLTVVVRHALAERVLLLARYYELDPRLLAALVSVESSWRPRAVSPVGALGFGQLMPATAASLDVMALEPYENLDGTARYLRRLLNRYPSADMLTRVRLALASYNAGPAAVARYKGVPPYRETQAYVRNVVDRWQRLGATLAGPTVLAASALLEQPAIRPRPTRTVAVAVTEPAPSLVPPRSPSVVPPHPQPVVPHDVKLAKRARKPLHVAAAAHARRPRRLIAAVLPITLPTPAPQPARWERSHSVFARLLGLRHRTGGSAPDTAQAPLDLPSSPAGITAATALSAARSAAAADIRY